MELYGKEHDINDLSMLIGDFSQAAGFKQYELNDGKAKGMRAIDVKTGSGLCYSIMCDKCLDIAHFEYKGIPFAHIAKSGLVAPWYYESRRDEWLWSFHGGLITTCGFVQAGMECELDGKEFGLHGRAANIPAEQICAYEKNEDNEIYLVVSGKVREAAMEQQAISLKRKIYTRVGSKKIVIEDIYKNEDFKPSPFMLIYHMNIGYPIFSEESQLYLPVETSLPFVEKFPDSVKGISEYDIFGKPTAEAETQVFFHELEKRETMNLCIVNERLKIGLGIEYDTLNLPMFTQARILKPTDYYTVLEPANCYPIGREKFDEKCRMVYLEGQQAIKNKLVLNVLDGEAEIDAYKAMC